MTTISFESFAFS